jgi:hypothetical protein
MAEDFPIPHVPFPMTPHGRARLLAPLSQHSSRTGSPVSRVPTPLVTSIPFNTVNPFDHLADNLADHIGNHIQPSDPLFDPIQASLAAGKPDCQSILALCLLLMQDNRETHSTLNTMSAKLDAIAATQAVHSATLNTVTQISASRPSPLPSRPSQGKAPSAPPARQLYSAAAKAPPPPAGPAGPPPAKKNKRKATGSPPRPPPVDYLSMSQSQLSLAMLERQKPDFDQAYNPLPHEWTKSNEGRKPKAPKATPSLPAAQRRFYATRGKAEELKDAPLYAASLPLTLARSLDSVKANVDKAFTVSINANGTVTVLASPTAPASSYASYFPMLTNALNTSLPVKENPYNIFNLAPTTSDYAIHNVPVHVLPDDQSELYQTMKDAIGFANGAIITAARYLKPKKEDRQKPTTSVVVSVTPDQAALLTDSIRLFSRPRKCEKMFSSSPVTQCRHCSKFGHPAQLCKQELPTCPICAGAHTREAHRCGNQGCVKGGNDKPVPACCDTTPLKCPNCFENHTASFPGCPSKVAAIAALHLRTNRTSSIPVASEEENADMADRVDTL